MQKIGFAEALNSIIASDPRYQRDAYVFLRDALDFTTKQQKKVKGVSVRHVTGLELLDGFKRQAAARQVAGLATLSVRVGSEPGEARVKLRAAVVSTTSRTASMPGSVIALWAPARRA